MENERVMGVGGILNNSDNGSGSGGIKFLMLQCLIQLILILLCFILGSSSLILAGIAVLGLVVIGIPHGGNDYAYRPDRSLKGTILFFAYYLGAMGVYAAVWYAFPIVALLLFLLISMHHFGQSNFETSTWLEAESLLWGLWLLLFPIVKHWAEVLGVFQQMLGRPVDHLAGVWKSDSIVLFLLSLSFGFVYFLVLRHKQPKKISIYMFQWLIVTIWYWITPLMLGFVVVFCYWHALQSIQYQIEYVKKEYQHSRWQGFKGFLPLGILAVIGMYFSVSFDVMGHLDLAFILLSLITLPHVIVMDGIYRK